MEIFTFKCFSLSVWALLCWCWGSEVFHLPTFFHFIVCARDNAFCYPMMFHWPETRVPLLLLGQEKLRGRLSCCESERAEDGLWVTDPLQMLPEDLHHFRGHLLVERHLNQLKGITSDNQSYRGLQLLAGSETLVRFISSFTTKIFLGWSQHSTRHERSVNNQWNFFWRRTTGLAGWL